MLMSLAFCTAAEEVVWGLEENLTVCLKRIARDNRFNRCFTDDIVLKTFEADPSAKKKDSGYVKCHGVPRHGVVQPRV